VLAIDPFLSPAELGLRSHVVQFLYFGICGHVSSFLIVE
jgi:hypothetical protein